MLITTATADGLKNSGRPKRKMYFYPNVLKTEQKKDVVFF